MSRTDEERAADIAAAKAEFKAAIETQQESERQAADTAAKAAQAARDAIVADMTKPLVERYRAAGNARITLDIRGRR